MSEQVSGRDKVRIETLPTGVPGLDEILGGGLPEFSFNIIAGAPGGARPRWPIKSRSPMPPGASGAVFHGAGRTGHQMLRYQQQFQFSTRPS
jgi:circadian clock protein KaiC